jgi:hypothetical protein
MIVTEEHAKEKWCPHVRIRHQSQAVVNRTPDPMHHADYGCIGSRCMSWRWRNSALDVGHEPKGFCGLAGIPTWIDDTPALPVRGE